jgi:hypothetical protein
MAARLTESEVRGIRKKLADRRYTTRMIARFYGVSTDTILGIKNGKTWQDVV